MTDTAGESLVRAAAIGIGAALLAPALGLDVSEQIGLTALLWALIYRGPR